MFRFTIRNLLHAMFIVALSGALARLVADDTIAAIVVLIWASTAGLGVYVHGFVSQ